MKLKSQPMPEFRSNVCLHLTSRPFVLMLNEPKRYISIFLLYFYFFSETNIKRRHENKYVGLWVCFYWSTIIRRSFVNFTQMWLFRESLRLCKWPGKKKIKIHIPNWPTPWREVKELPPHLIQGHSITLYKMDGIW
jgi:hypothetical protein